MKKIFKVFGKEFIAWSIVIILFVVTLIGICAMLTPEANAATKYTKIKTTTLKNYKKTISKQKKTISKQSKSITYWKTKAKELSDTPWKDEAEKYKGINDWLYNSLVNICGYKYNKSTKTWTIEGYNAITCFDCKNKFPHQPKGQPKYKFCPNCGSNNLDN